MELCLLMYTANTKKIVCLFSLPHLDKFEKAGN